MNTVNMETNMQTIERLAKERDEARAKCAEMRAVLEFASPPAKYHPLVREELDWFMRRDHALSPDCGKVWRSPEEYAALEAKVAAMQGVTEWAQAVLTALNVGEIKSGSPLHLKLREVMIGYRAELARL